MTLIIVGALIAAGYYFVWPADDGYTEANEPPRAPAPVVSAEACRDGSGWRAGCAFRECMDCPEMVVIPAGTFTMGSPPTEKGRSEDEGPQRAVNVARFALGKDPITRGEFAAFVRATGHESVGCTVVKENSAVTDTALSWRNPGYPQSDSHPVGCMTFGDAKAYVDWLSRSTGKTYRVPSEAEYEYATRAGTTTRFFWGEDPTDPKVCLEHVIDKSAPAPAPKAASCRKGERTAPVHSFPANGFGLRGMVGTGLQWTEDCWRTSYAGAPSDGSARGSDSEWTSRDWCQTGRALRGISLGGLADYWRSARRFWTPDHIRWTANGIRVARAL